MRLGRQTTSSSQLSVGLSPVQRDTQQLMGLEQGQIVFVDVQEPSVPPAGLLLSTINCAES